MNIIKSIENLPNFKANKNWAKLKNSITFINLFTRFYNICTSLFEYENVPPTWDTDFLEDALFWFGKAILVEDDQYGSLSLRAFENVDKNIYRRPINWTAFGFGGYNKVYHLENGLVGKDAVLVRNNKSMYPTASIIFEYVSDITDVKRAINVNVNSTKTPTIMIGDNDTIKTLKNAFKQQTENEGLIVLNSDMANSFDILDNTKAYISDKLLSLKHDLLAEVLAFMGIKYVNTEKAERLLTDEANSGVMFAEVSVDSMLEMRQQAIDNYNKMTGSNVKVRLKYDIKEMECEEKDEKRFGGRR